MSLGLLFSLSGFCFFPFPFWTFRTLKLLVTGHKKSCLFEEAPEALRLPVLEIAMARFSDDMLNQAMADSDDDYDSSDEENIPMAKVVLSAEEQRAMDEGQAEQAKGEGNSLYKGGDYRGAVERYSAAIELNETPAYLSNRAAAYLMLEQYKNAIADCKRAVEIDSNFLKGYLRWGKALMKMVSFFLQRLRRLDIMGVFAHHVLMKRPH